MTSTVSGAASKPWYDEARVSQRGSVILREHRQRMQQERAANAAGRWVPGQKRSFNAAQISRLTDGWTTQTTHLNQDLWRGLRVLRARSRDIAKNNEFAAHFISMVKTNVVGPAGIGLQVQALYDNGAKKGQIDEYDSSVVEAAFAEFGKLGHCDVTGKLTFTDLQKLYIACVAINGEVLVQRMTKLGPHKYQLRLLDPALLDESLKRDLPGGNRVRMGIELDALDRPVAYYLLPSETFDIDRGGGTSYQGRHLRVPAEEIWHDFVPLEIGQLRGVPWMAPAMLRLNMLAGYEEAAVIAARIGASQMGFFTTATGEVTDLKDSEVGDDTTGGESLFMDVEPGVFKGLPRGVSFEAFNPKYPHEMYAEFVKSCLRGVASGIGVSYNGLANDLEGVNLSSLRQGLYEEREVWKSLQDWMIGRFNARVFSEWLPLAMLAGAMPSLPFSKLYKYDSAVWQGRRWQTLDPLKDAESDALQITHALKSRGEVIRESGRDPETVWAELEKEKARLKDILPAIPPAAPASKPGAAASGDTQP